MVAREDMPTTLVCTDTTVSGAVAINWMVKSLGADEWKLVLSARETDRFSGGALKPSMRLTDPNFHDTGVFSLFLLPKLEDRGLYLCLIKQQEKKLKERKILLAILTGRTINPVMKLLKGILFIISTSAFESIFCWWYFYASALVKFWMSDFHL